MSRPRSYTDQALSNAVAKSRSWRGVLRALDLSATSASAIRSVRQHANDLGLDYRHFTGQRRWTNDQLRGAVAQAVTWSDVVSTLDLRDETSKVALRGHAARLGIDTSHLEPAPTKRPPWPIPAKPEPAHLQRSGALIAAAWFSLCGYDVSWPMEPARYDLLVTWGGIQRVQVKTTTVRAGRSWTVWLSTTGKSRKPYDVDEIDCFCLINAELDIYLIPTRVVGGLHAVTLSRYSEYLLTSGFAIPFR